MCFIDSFIEKYKIKAVKNYNTAKLSTIKSGGFAEIIVFPDTIDELIGVVDLCKRNSVCFKIIGNCSNTVFSDNGYDGVIISTKSLNSFEIKKDRVEIECGALYSNTAVNLAKGGYILPPELCGIPGSIGGMVRNNAGAFDKCIADVFDYGFFYRR